MSFYVLKDVDWAWDVKPKALEFKYHAIPPTGESLAQSVVGLYCIQHGGQNFRLRFRDSETLGDFKTIEEAETAAQADYSARIMSAIEPAGVGVETQPPSTHLTGFREIDERAKEAGPVLILVDGRIIEATYDRDACEWSASHWGIGFGNDPTHWMPLPSMPAKTAATHVNGGAYRRVSRAEWDRLGGAANEFCDWHEGIGYVVYNDQARSEYRAKVASPSPQPRAALTKEATHD